MNLNHHSTSARAAAPGHALEVSIFRVGLKKIPVISGQKNLAYDHPTGRIGP
jgi:hypothetical protein